MKTYKSTYDFYRGEDWKQCKAQIITTWSFAQGSIEWNSNTGTFAFNNGMM